MTRLRRLWPLPLVPVLALTLTGATKCQADGATAAQAATAPRYQREYRYAKHVFGIHGTQKRCLIALWDRESGWDPYAVNRNSGAAGIPQALPAVWGHPFALGDWRAQIRWGAWYIGRRYGSPCAAWQHEESAGWY